MLKLTNQLKKLLKGADRIAVLAVGSDIRGDDAAGLIVGENILSESKKKKPAGKIKVFYGGTAPENMTGEIKKYNPSCIVIVDSADTSSKPGTVMIIEKESIQGISFSTHMMPLKMLVDYLGESVKCRIIVVGIQPKSIEFGDKVSKEVIDSAGQVACAILNAYAADQ